MRKYSSLLLLIFVAAQAALLAGCGDSGDGAVMSDEDKIKKASAGREAQMAGQNGQPPAASGTTNP